MNIEIGLNRLATVVVGLGIAWAELLGLFVLGVLIKADVTDRVELFAVMAGLAVLGYVAARVLAWVIRGFAEPKKPA